MAIHYQWQLSTDQGNTYKNIEQYENTLSLSGIQPTQHNHMYRCRMNRGGSEKYRYSNAVYLKVLPDIEIQDIPNIISITGGSLSLSPTITISPNAHTSFQWQYSDNEDANYYNIVGETGSSISLSNVSRSNNNRMYRLQVTSYYASGINNTVFSSPSKVTIDQDLPEIQIWKNPQHYYGTGIASFSAIIASTGLNTNNIPNDFYDETHGLTYGWEESLDGKKWYSLLSQPSNSPNLYISNNNNAKEGYHYRVNVSKNNHTVLSEKAIISSYFSLPDLSSIPSNLTKNIFCFRNSNNNQEILQFQVPCNNTTNSASLSSCYQNIRLITIQENTDKYDLILDLYSQKTQSTNNNYEYAIRDILLFKNNSLIKSASNDATRILSSNTINNITPTSTTQFNNTTKKLTSEYVGIAGKEYGQGYVINFNTTLHPNILQNTNYFNLLRNCIVKCSNKTQGTIKIGITTTGRTNIDDLLISKLPAVANIGNFARLNISYELLPYTNTFDNIDSYDVIVLNNSYNWATKAYQSSEQIKLKTFIADGGGLITGEWVLWNASRGRLNELKQVFPIVPTNNYNSSRNVRLYQYNTDPIINYEVDPDFSFDTVNIAGTQTLSNLLDINADLFYVNEVSKKDETSDANYYEETTFNILDILHLSAKSTDRQLSINKPYSCDFYFNDKIDKDVKIGGMLYWIYKSLIEHHRKPDPGQTKESSPWSASRIPLYSTNQANKLNDILLPYGLNYQDFDYNNPATNETLSDISINDDFWKDLSKLLSSIKPENALSKNSREAVQSRVFLTYDGTLPSYSLLNNTSQHIKFVVSHTRDLPINATLQKKITDINFENVETIDNSVNNTSIFLSGLEASNTYRILFSTEDGKTTSSREFYIDDTTTATSSAISNFGVLTDGHYINVTGSSGIFTANKQLDANTDNTTLLFKNCSFNSWQYSYDNKNFYNTTHNVVDNTDDTTITLDTQAYDKIIRYSYTTNSNENSIGYSRTKQYDLFNIYLLSDIYNQYEVSGSYYIDFNMTLVSGETAEILPPSTRSGILWQQYDPLLNSYENIPNTSGYSVLNISGIPADLQDNYRFRAIVNDRIIYS